MAEHSPAYYRAQNKTDVDFANMINAYWGREVVAVERYQIPRFIGKGKNAGTYVMEWATRISSVVGPWVNGFPPRAA